MVDEIPLEVIYKHPLVQNLLNDNEAMQDLDKIKLPFILKDKILMSPGTWNNFYYSAATIKEAFSETDWENKDNRALFLDHLDKNSSEWIGEIKNPRIQGEELIGDLVVVDKSTAIKLAYGAKMGISPKVTGQEENNVMHRFLFNNFSVVMNPAVKTAYINNSQIETPQEVPKMAEVIENSIVVEENKKKAVPVVEEPKPVEAPVVEAPKAEEPKVAEPVVEVPKVEEPKPVENSDKMAEFQNTINVLKSDIEELKGKVKIWDEEMACKKKKLEEEELACKKKKMEEALPEEKHPEGCTCPECMKAKVVPEEKKMEQTVNTMSEQETTQTITENVTPPVAAPEPERATVKATEELSKKPAGEPTLAELDRGMLNMLKRLNGY